MAPDVKLDYFVVGIALLLCTVLLGVVGWAGVMEAREWSRYALVHDCKVVSTSVAGVWTSGTPEAPAACHNATVTCYACAPGPLGVSVCRVR